MVHVYLEVRGSKGDFEVVQFAPVTLGRFAQREHAEIFCDALRRGDVAAEEANPVPPQIVEAEIEPSADAVEAEAEPKPDPDEVDAALRVAESQSKDIEAELASVPTTTEVAAIKPERAAPRSEPVAMPKRSAPMAPADLSNNDPRWAKAMDRLEAGAKLKVVAEDLGLPFYALRARWAAAISTGARVKPGPADGPVSGGPAGVLARGRKSTWSETQDAALMVASDQDLPDVARKIGVSIEDARKRRAALEAKMKKLMAEG